MIFRAFDQQLGIDLGTSNTLLYSKDKGVVLREPTVITIRKDTKQIQAIGTEANAMVGRTPDDLQIIYPVMDGVIANFEMTIAMLKLHIRKALEGKFIRFSRLHIIISVPCGISNVKRRAVEDAAIQAGAKKAIIVEEPLAAAIGCGLSIQDPLGHMVVCIGGGLTQTALISLGGIVEHHVLEFGGLSIDRMIIEHIKKEHNLAIGQPTAERIKIEIGMATNILAEETLEVRGNDVVSGLPKMIHIRSGEIYPLFDDFVMAIVDSVRVTLENSPPELAGDVIEQGIMLCGGGSLIRGLSERLSIETDIPVHLSEDPIDCVALGIGKLMTTTPSSWEQWSQKFPTLSAKDRKKDGTTHS